MKPFDQLTDNGKTRRLRKLAFKALEQYPIEVRKLTLITGDWNAVFRIDTAEGEKYAMRVCVPEFTVEETRSEMMWMAAIRADTDIHVPLPMKNHDGEYVTVASIDGVPEPRQCVVLSWVCGSVLDDSLSPDVAVEWGKLLARLHNHSRTFQPPQGFNRFTYNDVFPFPTDELVLFSGEYRDLLKHDAEIVMKRALERAQTAIKALHGENDHKQVLHGDLHPWNVMRCRGKLAVIDFEDIVWGYPVQDVGISLYHIMYHENYPALRAAFLEGYTSESEWTEADVRLLDSMVVARAFNIHNLGLTLVDDRDWQQERTERFVKRLRGYLETGTI